MGSQIAQQCALHGYQVNLTDVDEALLEPAVANNRALLQNRVTKGRLSQERADAAWQRVRPVKTLEDAAGQADFVIEAVFENLEVTP
jgi:3-hydroxybutyryl-CoA dehydrogenase